MKQRLLELFALVLVVVGVAGLVTTLSPAPVAFAGTAHNLSGWAWSSNVGWFSFNCTDTGTCGTADYGVTIDSTTNDLSGYAWNKYVGWLSFNAIDVSDCDTAPCTPHYDPSTRKLSGWAKVVRGVPNVPDPAWNGFVKLSGLARDNSPFGVIKDASGGGFSGYSWAEAVIGWMDWKPNGGGVTYNSVVAPHVPADKIVIAPIPQPMADEPVVITLQALSPDATIDTAFNNDVNIFVSCTGETIRVDIQNGVGLISVTFPDPETCIITLQAIPNETPTYLNLASTRSVTVVPPGPTVDIDANPKTFLGASGTTNITWRTTGNGLTCSASANPPGNIDNWSGGKQDTNTAGESHSISGTVLVTLTCNGVTDSVTITVNSAEELIEADVSTSTIPSVTLSDTSTQTVLDPVTRAAIGVTSILEWQPKNVQSCVGEEGDVAWRTPKNVVAPPVLRYQTPTLNKHTTYRITCVGADPTLVATAVATVYNGTPPAFNPVAFPNVLRVSFVSNKSEITTKLNVRVNTGETSAELPSLDLKFSTPQVQNSIRSDFAGANAVRSATEIRGNAAGISHNLTHANYNAGADMRLVVPTRLRGGEYKTFKIEARSDLGPLGVITKEIPITLIVQDFRPQFNER